MAGGTNFSGYLRIRAIEAGSSEMIYAGLAVIVFGFFTIRVLVRLLPGHASLTLDPAGDEVHNAYERRSWMWRNGSNFRLEAPDDNRLPDRRIFDVAGKKPLRGSPGGGSLPEGDRLRSAGVAMLIECAAREALALPRTRSTARISWSIPSSARGRRRSPIRSDHASPSSAPPNHARCGIPR